MLGFSGLACGASAARAARRALPGWLRPTRAGNARAPGVFLSCVWSNNALLSPDDLPRALWALLYTQRVGRGGPTGGIAAALVLSGRCCQQRHITRVYAGPPSVPGVTALLACGGSPHAVVSFNHPRPDDHFVACTNCRAALCLHTFGTAGIIRCCLLRALCM